ncbi:MAG: hypothetical protein CMI74_05660 [Candidatus Pelagibacter sp.]|jgi:hypothetical protein|nr:hypothetical protein [Candidatus Pelagibacter sp.]
MATTISNDVVRIFPKQETLTAATTLTAADSGKTYLISGTGYTVTLPAPFAGFSVKFIVAAAFSTDTVVQTPADNRDTLNGGVIVNGAIVESDATDRVTFEDGAESIGDFIEITSDGTSFFLFGNGNASSSITVGEL